MRGHKVAGVQTCALPIFVGAVICLSLVVLTGYVGQISLAQMAFAGVGGFTVSKLAMHHGLGFPIGPILGAAVAVVVGLAAALPALPARRVNPALLTLAAAAPPREPRVAHPPPAAGTPRAPGPAPPLLGF